jgi:hypothetical protein
MAILGSYYITIVNNVSCYGVVGFIWQKKLGVCLLDKEIGRQYNTNVYEFFRLEEISGFF